MPATAENARQQITEWKPATGWVESKAGVWIPPGYQASRWEIEAPAIVSRHVAAIDYAKCVKSLPYFAFTHVWTVDVDDPSGDALRKMPAFPHLRRFFSAVQVPSNILVEKSRQMLMSWAWMSVFLWDILFHDNWPDLVISKRAKDVDDGGINSTPDSNLGKLRFMYEHLPEHLWQPFEIKHYKIRNTARESHVTGETGVGGKASRGPTFKRGLMDEGAYIDRSESVFKGVRQAAKTGTALNSTPNGKGNAFARIRFDPHSTFRKFSFHWSEHPRKSIGAYCECGWRSTPNAPQFPHEQYAHHRIACPLPENQKRIRSPWYDLSARDMRPEDVASELDISYERSQRGRVWYAFDSTIHTFDHTRFKSHQEGRAIGERRVTESNEAYRMRYLRGVMDPTKQPVVGWDFGVDPSSTDLVLGQVEDESSMFIRWLDIYENTNQSYKHYGQFFLDTWLAVWIEIGGPMWYDFAHYGDPAGAARGSDLTSWISNLRQEPYGIHIQSAHIRKNASKTDWLDFVNDRYRENQAVISTYATLLIDTMQQYHYPIDDATGQPVVGKQEPVHDEWSHPADAKRYVYQGRWPHRLRIREAQAASRSRRIVATAGRGLKPYEVREW